MSDFQGRVHTWVTECFGRDIATDSVERKYRFLEEALELAQACHTKKEKVLELVEYVYSRPMGDILQEVGGTLITLAALCAALGAGIDMEECGERELLRCLENIDKIRIKGLTKADMITGYSVFARRKELGL